MQHEVTKRQRLLDSHGHIVEPGWARRPVWEYDKREIHASKLRIKEWDYYAIISESHRIAITATFSDLGFAGLFAIAYIDYDQKRVAQKEYIKPLLFGSLGLPNHSKDHAISITHSSLRLAFSRKQERRRIVCASPSLEVSEGVFGLDCDATLIQNPELESMNIATSWKEKQTAFYLNEKVFALPVLGEVTLGEKIIQLTPDESFGILDWGRGRWTYSNRWYWACASGTLNGVRFGFNLGYGFSDRSMATENVILYENTLYKLEEVTFHIPKESYVEPWTITSSNKRCELVFIPAVDRSSYTNFRLIKSEQHQVFGYFSGTLTLDYDTTITIEHVLGFAEDVYNRF